VDELRGRLDRLEQQLRRLRSDAGPGEAGLYDDLPD
jgi:hypothetical protein